MGKSLGTDLEKQKPTLPIIHLLTQCSPAERREAIGLLASHDRTARTRLRAWLAESDSLGYTRRMAEQYATAASDETRQLTPSPAHDVLVTLTELVVSRQD